MTTISNKKHPKKTIQKILFDFSNLSHRHLMDRCISDDENGSINLNTISQDTHELNKYNKKRKITDDNSTFDNENNDDSSLNDSDSDNNILDDKNSNDIIHENNTTQEEDIFTENSLKVLIPFLLGKNIPDPQLSIKEKIISSNLPTATKEMVLKRLANVDLDKPKQLEWIESLLTIPFGKFATTPVSIKDSQEKLHEFFDGVVKNFDKQVYGLQNVKQEIIDYLAQFITSGNESNPRVLALWGSAGVGKCLHPDTPVLIWNDNKNRFKLAKDIQIGDMLIGDDSTSRTVLSVCKGIDPMYRVRQEKGEDYIVNSAHMLSLKIVHTKFYSWIDKLNSYVLNYFDKQTISIIAIEFKASSEEYKTKTLAEQALFKKIKEIESDIILDISVENYLTLNKEIQSYLAGFKVGVDYPSKSEGIKIDPYLLGKCLGNELYITEFINDDIRIPAEYIYNDRITRLEFLAGLIDAGGHLDNYSGYKTIKRNKYFIEDIVYLARSLGFEASSEKVQTVSINNSHIAHTSYKCSITGNGIEEIPCKIKRNIFIKQKINNTLVYDIQIEPLGLGDYCGFTLDGNGRFLLGDFTVTHNTYIIRTALSEALNRPMRCINMGGVKDSVYMTGFDYSYSSARYGVIAQTLIEKQVMNPIVVFEEVDKISETKDGVDIQNILMHLTDPEQNNTFQDKYFQNIDIDMSKAILVFTLNDPTLLHPILLNRLNLIKVADPSVQDKINIAIKYMIPKLCSNIGFDSTMIVFKEQIVSYINNKYSSTDKGLRTLKKNIESILLRINTIKLTGVDFQKKLVLTFPVLITEKIVDVILFKKEATNDSPYVSMYM